jgi:hypothetical protein
VSTADTAARSSAVSSNDSTNSSNDHDGPPPTAAFLTELFLSGDDDGDGDDDEDGSGCDDGIDALGDNPYSLDSATASRLQEIDEKLELLIRSQEKSTVDNPRVSDAL